MQKRGNQPLELFFSPDLLTTRRRRLAEPHWRRVRKRRSLDRCDLPPWRWRRSSMELMWGMEESRWWESIPTSVENGGGGSATVVRWERRARAAILDLEAKKKTRSWSDDSKIQSELDAAEEIGWDDDCQSGLAKLVGEVAVSWAWDGAGGCSDVMSSLGLKRALQRASGAGAEVAVEKTIVICQKLTRFSPVDFG